MIKVDKEIEIPLPRSNYKGFRGLLESMGVGDSIFIDDSHHQTSKVVAARIFFRKNGMSSTARKHANGVRIWRTK